MITEEQSLANKEALLQTFLTSIREIQESFTSPDDDFIPVLILLDDGDRSKILGFDPSYLENAESKTRWKAAMKKAVIDFSAVSAMVTSSTWLREAESDEIIGEAVLCNVVTPHGSWAWTIDIIRNDNEVPQLGELEEMKSVESSLTSALAQGIFAVIDSQDN